MALWKSCLKSSLVGLMAAFALLPSPTAAAPDEFVSGLASLGAGSTRKMDVGLLGAYLQFGGNEPRESGFYSKARYAHFVVLLENERVQGVSYDALFPGFATYSVLAIALNEFRGDVWARVPGQIVGLANGEFGYRYGSLSIGLVNGIHPFFTRRWYHDAGVRLGFGNHAEWGLTVFEEDRFRRGTMQYGAKLDFQGYWGW